MCLQVLVDRFVCSAYGTVRLLRPSTTASCVAACVSIRVVPGLCEMTGVRYWQGIFMWGLRKVVSVMQWAMNKQFGNHEKYGLALAHDVLV